MDTIFPKFTAEPCELNERVGSITSVLAETLGNKVISMSLILCLIYPDCDETPGLQFKFPVADNAMINIEIMVWKDKAPQLPIQYPNLHDNDIMDDIMSIPRVT